MLPDKIDSSFVYYYFKCARETIEGLGGGTTFKEISGAAAAKIPLAVAPLAEQRRIVAEIETQFTRLDASVAALRRAQANLKRYRSSVLKDACEGRLVPIEAELARSEGREYEPADVLLERILAERRARWESAGEAAGQVQGSFRPGHVRPPGTAGRVGVGYSGATLRNPGWNTKATETRPSRQSIPISQGRQCPARQPRLRRGASN